MGFILPSIRDGLARGASVEGLALVEAMWARMCLGEREDGSLIEANDPAWDALKNVASQAKIAPRRWLEMEHIYGEIAGEERFANAFDKHLQSLYEKGAEATINAYLACDDTD